ncbi:hypothetical protein [Rhodoferax sp. GW822-FHT02A01]|uniref:hypothetical protein n=1 Tax=Rhodoferax sp. GW822-FHT02A01 TaxID=3141537 RepID=UPI00315D8597
MATEFSIEEQAEREALIIHAACGIEALTNVLLREINSNEDSVELETFTRFALQKIHALNGVIVSVKGDDDARTTEEMSEVAKAPLTTPEEIQKLHATVNLMDCLSQGGFSEISSIAKLALISLETPEGHRHLDNVVRALESIWGKADEIQNSINWEAEQVGCNYVDEAERRRQDARRMARAQEVGVAHE